MDHYTHYTYEEPPANMETEPAEETEAAAYEMTLIPEGYSLMTLDNCMGETDYVYADYESGNTLYFFYIRGSGSLETVISHENAALHTVTVRGVKADLYLPDGPTNDSACLVWMENGCMMCISGSLSQEEIIRLAESVTEVP